jgi:hypothetical protein
VIGLKYPIKLSVSRESGRAYVHDGNHRMSVLKDLDIEWVPVSISYFFINRDHERYPLIPAGRLAKYLEYPNAREMGLETKDISPSEENTESD